MQSQQNDYKQTIKTNDDPTKRTKNLQQDSRGGSRARGNYASQRGGVKKGCNVGGLLLKDNASSNYLVYFTWHMALINHLGVMGQKIGTTKLIIYIQRSCT